MKGLGPAQLGPGPGLGVSDGLHHPLRHDILNLPFYCGENGHLPPSRAKAIASSSR
jgi:hypothetical protein